MSPSIAGEAAVVRLAAPGCDANRHRLIAWAGERMVMRHGIRVRLVRLPETVAGDPSTAKLWDVLWADAPQWGDGLVLAPTAGRTGRLLAAFLVSPQTRRHARMLAAQYPVG